MIRFLTFVLVIAGLMIYFYLSSRPRGHKEPNLKNKPKGIQKSPPANEFWIQVYDTDSIEEAQKIQSKFHDMNIQCFLYEQGKKDIYGNLLKHYGISVPRKNFEKAQAILSQITL